MKTQLFSEFTENSKHFIYQGGLSNTPKGVEEGQVEKTKDSMQIEEEKGVNETAHDAEKALLNSIEGKKLNFGADLVTNLKENGTNLTLELKKDGADLATGLGLAIKFEKK